MHVLFHSGIPFPGAHTRNLKMCTQSWVEECLQQQVRGEPGEKKKKKNKTTHVFLNRKDKEVAAYSYNETPYNCENK